MNLCVKIKLNKLQPALTDAEVQKTKLFFNANCVKEACKLYIWYVKVVTCEGYNALPNDELSVKYTRAIARYCRIVNAPVRNPNKEVEEAAKQEGKVGKKGKVGKERGEGKEGGEGKESGEGKGEFVTVEVEIDESGKEIPVSKQSSDEGKDSSNEGKDSSNEGKESSNEGKESSNEGKESSNESGKETSNDGATSNQEDSQPKEEPVVESFTEHNIDFFNSSLNIEKMTYDDYKYIMGTILFILLIFFIYIRYRN